MTSIFGRTNAHNQHVKIRQKNWDKGVLPAFCTQLSRGNTFVHKYDSLSFIHKIQGCTKRFVIMVLPIFSSRMAWLKDRQVRILIFFQLSSRSTFCFGKQQHPVPSPPWLKGPKVDKLPNLPMSQLWVSSGQVVFIGTCLRKFLDYTPKIGSA